MIRGARTHGAGHPGEHWDVWGAARKHELFVRTRRACGACGDIEMGSTLTSHIFVSLYSTEVQRYCVENAHVVCMRSGALGDLCVCVL